MFTKIDKKILIILIIAAIVILLLGFAIYRYMAVSGIKVQDTTASSQTQQNAQADAAQPVQVRVDGVQGQGADGGGVLSVCMDKCGDGICQETDPNCKGSNLNCICPETPQECPKDCK